MNERFDELLPWYVNGTLAVEERAWVDQYLLDHPQAAGQLHFYEKLSERLVEDTPQVSDEIGLAKAMARIHALGKVAAPQAARRTAQAAGPMQRLRDWLGSFAMTPALGAAMAIVAVQALVIATMVNEPDESSQIRSAPGALPGEGGAFIKLNLRPDAREEDIRFLLVGVQGSLAAGPSQLGDYYVRVAPAQRDAILAKLQASPLVQGASIIDGLPPRE